ncbi:S8 family serine peptidase [Lichenifustis flavocetrariae]|uniref:S8 family serine peptidase n=1 Tax=Lichenifustis flavocetrariae TaxID=2949735 RepID=A0AA41YWE2_9HYPH|nr:S8 family serine peptidase [Lichenifustis flavocetrariae]MCW6509816.1 S8 family serine peptidase [Lichenifustis flavocetrariae]
MSWMRGNCQLSAGVLSVCTVLIGTRSFAGDQTPFNADAIAQIQSAQVEKNSRTPIEMKMSSDLLILSRPESSSVANRAALAHQVITGVDGRISVNVFGVVSDKLKQEITDLGGTVKSSVSERNILNVEIPSSSIKELAAKPEVTYLRPSPQGTVEAIGTGESDVAGEVAHDAAAARAKFGVNGTGVSVCVLSDSVDHLGEAQDAGAVGDVQILPGQQGHGKGEGTAMLEILHRIAPGAMLKFATGLESDVGMAANIKQFTASGCRIIVDDILYFDESPFQDGLIAQAVDEASQAGVLYFSAAANNGNVQHHTAGTWQGDFLDGGPVNDSAGKEIGRYVSFAAPGEQQQATGNLVSKNPMTGRSESTADLFWNDPLGHSSNEYDLYAVNSDGSIAHSSNSPSIGASDPYQTVPISAGQRLVVVKMSKAAPRYLYLDTNRLALQVATSGAVRGHNAADGENAFSVGAVNVSSPPGVFAAGGNLAVAGYSSDGPRHLYYEVDGSFITPADLTRTGGRIVKKPDFCAADGVDTGVPGFSHFTGTSAAAPHAAAIAALLMSFNSHLTGKQIRGALTSTAIPIGGPNPDVASGAGILMPTAALGSIATAGAAMSSDDPVQRK